MRFDNPEDIIQLTPIWTGERFANGRPKVPDSILRRLQSSPPKKPGACCGSTVISTSSRGTWKIIHPGKDHGGPGSDRRDGPQAPRPGYLPARIRAKSRRPARLLQLLGDREPGRRTMSWWSICSTRSTKAPLSAATCLRPSPRRTKRGGQVIWGGIRDVQQVMGITNINTFYRGNDPTPIRDVTLIGMNVPCRIGNAICMPGDVVLGTPAGDHLHPAAPGRRMLHQGRKSEYARPLWPAAPARRHLYHRADRHACGPTRSGPTSTTGARPTPRPNTSTWTGQAKKKKCASASPGRRRCSNQPILPE